MNKLKEARKIRNKLDKEWKRQVIYEFRGLCAVCLKSKSEVRLNCHHILAKEGFPELRHDVMNGILLCSSHHKFGKFSAHKNGIWFSEWLREHRFEQFYYLSKIIQKFI